MRTLQNKFYKILRIVFQRTCHFIISHSAMLGLPTVRCYGNMHRFTLHQLSIAGQFLRFFIPKNFGQFQESLQ